MQFQLFGTLLVFALLIGLTVNRYVYKQNMTYWLSYVICSFFGARLFFVIGNFDGFFDTFVRLLYWRNGGMDVWGAVVGFLCIHFYLHRRNSLIELRHILAPLSLLLFLLSWVFVTIPEGYGRMTESIVGIQPYAFVIDSIAVEELGYFHPLFIYSALFWLVIFIVLTAYKKHTLFMFYIAFPLWRIILLFFMDTVPSMDIIMIALWLLGGFLLYLSKTRFKLFI